MCNYGNKIAKVMIVDASLNKFTGRAVRERRPLPKLPQALKAYDENVAKATMTIYFDGAC